MVLCIVSDYVCLLALLVGLCAGLKFGCCDYVYGFAVWICYCVRLLAGWVCRFYVVLVVRILLAFV